MPLPANASIVCRFLEDQGEDKADSAVQRRLYAIDQVCPLLKLLDRNRDEDIFFTFLRVERPSAKRPKQAKGLTKDYLDLFEKWEPSTFGAS